MLEDHSHQRRRSFKSTYYTLDGAIQQLVMDEKIPNEPKSRSESSSLGPLDSSNQNYKTWLRKIKSHLVYRHPCVPSAPNLMLFNKTQLIVTTHPLWHPHQWRSPNGKYSHITSVCIATARLVQGSNDGDKDCRQCNPVLVI